MKLKHVDNSKNTKRNFIHVLPAVLIFCLFIYVYVGRVAQEV
jgi:hypothetical protein